MRTEKSTWIGAVAGHCEGLPGGAFIFSVPGVGVRTNFGMRSLPPGNSAASYCRIADDGYRVVAQGQDDDRAWVWAGEWKNLGVPAFGPNACIFNGDGDPWVISGPPAVGYRHVRDDRQVVTCEATYADPARGLYEFTEWPDVAVGQGGKDIQQGAVVRFSDGILRRFATGTIRNIRVRRDRDQFAIGMCNFDTRTATITWCSLAELKALPAVTAAPAPPTPTPAPPVPPAPKPPTPETPAMDYLAIIKRVRAKYSTPLGSQHWAFLVDVAQQTGTQLYRKEDDNSVRIPALGKRVSLDIIGRGTLGNQWADILGNSEGTADPVFQLKDTPADGEYVDVSGVALPGTTPPVLGPAPAPGPSPAPDVISSILSRLDALEGPHNVTIRANDGRHYLCAEGAGGGEVNATRTAVGGWEVFTIETAK